MTSSHHAPYVLGCTRATMAGTMGCHGLPPRERERIPKAGPSSDWRLQPASMKSELLVIADQHAAVNAFPGLVHTARHTTRVDCTRSRRPNLVREAPKVWLPVHSPLSPSSRRQARSVRSPGDSPAVP